MRLRDLSYILVILSLASATGSAQMGFLMQHSLGLSNDINNATGLAQLGDKMQHSFGLPDGVNNDTSGGDYLSFSFPWYSSDISFSRSGFNTSSELGTSHELSSAFSFFRGFYANSGMPSVSGIISTPIKFDITHREPAKIYFGSGHELQYARYVSSLTSRNNELWIQGGSSSGGIDWSQYVVCPSGAWLQLVAYSPDGGPAGFYEIVQNEAKTMDYKTYQFYPGYNTMSFSADQVGRHILLFVVNNQPSNAVIVDVFAQVPNNQVQTMPPTIQTPLQGTYNQPPSGSTQNPSYAEPSAIQITGDTPVTIQTSMKGYDVYLDGVLIGKEGINGDQLDGVFRFNVVGGQTHTIRVFDGANNYEKPMFFEKGVPKTINVPPATTIYIPGGLH